MPDLKDKHGEAPVVTTRAPLPSHEAWFAAVPQAARERLVQIQAEVERRVPGAARCIAYQMPAFRRGKVFFYFAAFKRHIGVYPPVIDDAALIDATAPYRGPKGNLAFPLDEPLPLDLIGRVAEALAARYAPLPTAAKGQDR